jgi:hypothetical protein
MIFNIHGNPKMHAIQTGSMIEAYGPRVSGAALIRKDGDQKVNRPASSFKSTILSAMTKTAQI